METVRYVRNGDGYDVMQGERLVGRVMKSWSRTVGWGWRGTSLDGRSADYRTRQQAGRAVAVRAA